jgi:hypothetical protein
MDFSYFITKVSYGHEQIKKSCFIKEPYPALTAINPVWSSDPYQTGLLFTIFNKAWFAV